MTATTKPTAPATEACKQFCVSFEHWHTVGPFCAYLRKLLRKLDSGEHKEGDYPLCAFIGLLLTERLSQDRCAEVVAGLIQETEAP